MEFYTVCLFGHRDIYDLRKIDKHLTPIIEDLIRRKQFVTFMIGRKGEFDEYAASVIKGVQRRRGKDNNELTLVLPYPSAKMEDYERYYDDIIIPEGVCKAHPKSAITLNNRWMVEHSDLVVVYVERENGGAYTAMKYAQRLGKAIINIAEEDTDDD